MEWWELEIRPFPMLSYITKDMKRLKISRERMKKVGEVVFATFDAARKCHTLTMKQVLVEGILTYREQVYAV